MKKLIAVVGVVLGACHNHGGEEPAAPAGWGSAVELLEGSDPHVAMDGHGNAMVVWLKEGEVLACRHRAGVGWDLTETISISPASALGPRVAVDDTGRAVAVWEQAESIWVNSFDPREGWSGAQLVESQSAPATAPRVVMTGGEALIVWNQESGYTRTWFNRPGGTEAPVAPDHPEVDAGPAGPAVLVELAAGPSGTAQAVWQQHARFGIFIWACRWNGASWDYPETVSAANAFAPKIAVDGQGRAFAAWTQDGGRVMANRFDGQAWGEPQVLQSGAMMLGAVSVAVDEAGRAHVIWSEAAGVLCARFEGAWSILVPFDANGLDARAAGSFALWRTLTDVKSVEGALDNSDATVEALELAASGDRAVAAWAQGGKVYAAIRP